MSVMIGAILVLASVAVAAGAAGGGQGDKLGPGDLRVILGERAATPERRAAELFVGEVRRRTGLEVAIGPGPARRSLLIGTAESSPAIRSYANGRRAPRELGRDGYHINTVPGPEGRLYVIGESPSGVVAGVGKLLRLLRYADGSVTLPPLTLDDAPALPVRGIYFATHFQNFYHVAPLDEVDRIIEDFALWGGNSLSVWFDMHHFTGFDDPAAQAHLARLKHLGETAHALGMQFGLTFIANEAYSTSPEELRAKWLPSWAHYHVELCPSKPEGLALIGKGQARVLDAFPAVDFIWTWPYDQGGCACEQCKPWGANGFLKASEQLSRLYRERFPGGKVWLSTWLFDSVAGAEGEYDGLFRALRDQQPHWLDGILTGTHRDSIPKQLAARPAPDRYPLTCFPEISMYEMNPWGGCGANPLPDFCTRLARDVRGRVQGGWPYSEGIYEDLNKFLWCEFFRAPDRPTDDLLAEYAAYYLSPESAADGVRLFHLLEQTHPRNGWRVRNLARADEAFTLAQAIDRRIPPYARTSWRWRLLYLRAEIDHTLKHQGYLTPEAQAALTPLCDEIVRIYHAENSFIRPPALPTPRDPGNIAFGRPVSPSSTHPECIGSEQMLTDGVLAQDDAQNFWAHDPAREKTARLVIDLGEAREIKELRLQFRGIHDQFWFIPTTIALDVSEDGVDYEPVGTFDRVPEEGTPYSPGFWAYQVGKRGRCLRLTLGPSQHLGDQYAGTLELTEIEVQ